jgi:hypothetical protein
VFERSLDRLSTVRLGGSERSEVEDIDPVRQGTRACLSASSQLRDLVSYAQGQGAPLEIFTSASLASSGELFNWIQSGQVIINPIP